MDLATRAELVPNLRRYSGGKDQRTAPQYAADLTVETDRSLRSSPRWQAGLPLADNERWPNLVHRRSWRPWRADPQDGHEDPRIRRSAAHPTTGRRRSTPKGT